MRSTRMKITSEREVKRNECVDVEKEKKTVTNSTRWAHTKKNSIFSMDKCLLTLRDRKLKCIKIPHTHI